MRIAVSRERTTQASNQATAAKKRTATINARIPGSERSDPANDPSHRFVQ